MLGDKLSFFIATSVLLLRMVLDLDALELGLNQVNQLLSPRRKLAMEPDLEEALLERE